MSKVRITQVRSSIDQKPNQKKTLKAFGFNKIGQSVELEATPQILGMVRAVQHLVKVVEI
jgi:large subunit ribosomal protein L30